MLRSDSVAARLVFAASLVSFCVATVDFRVFPCRDSHSVFDKSKTRVPLDLVRTLRVPKQAGMYRYIRLSWNSPA